MTIRHIAIHHFGSIISYEAEFAPELNIIDSRYTAELSTALAFLLCSTPSRAIPKDWIRQDTLFCATVDLDNTVYSVSATPGEGRLQLSAVAPSGEDATAHYRYALLHCPEQDAMESFDGQDKTIPTRLCRYRNQEDFRELSLRTGRLADTNTFRGHLLRYIKAFQSEPINCQKDYRTAISPQGEFQVFHPDISGNVFLSQTEEKLFRYICFLNIAAFWEDLEQIRDLHWEKKPLMIRNFVEFLDESANISGLVARTRKLDRQIIILTTHTNEEIKKKWIGEYNGLFFNCCSRNPSL